MMNLRTLKNMDKIQQKELITYCRELFSCMDFFLICNYCIYARTIFSMWIHHAVAEDLHANSIIRMNTS